MTIHTKGRDPPQAGNYDPSVAVLVAEYLKLKQRGTSRKVWTRLNNAINKFTMRTQNMHAGGRTAPWWGATAGMVEKMSYECDDKLMAPAEVDCAQVEWSELGPDDETVALGPTLSKVLGYSMFSKFRGILCFSCRVIGQKSIESKADHCCVDRHVPARHYRCGDHHCSMAPHSCSPGHTSQRLPC